MKLLYSISLILFGIIFFIFTYIDGKKKKATLTTGYIMHIRGYIGAIGLVLAGIMLLLDFLGMGWW